MKGGKDTNSEIGPAGPSASGAGQWLLTREAFDKLLARLDDERDRAGEKYQELRAKLIRFFEWHGAAFPEDNADTSINRVARKIDEGEQIRDLLHYSLGVSRMVLREIQRNRAREEQALDEFAQLNTVWDEPSDSGRQFECLQRCLRELSAADRELIVEYYRGEKKAKIENRKALAARLGTSIFTLRMRAVRLRDNLEICGEECLEEV
jgi:hypothetical protein